MPSEAMQSHRRLDPRLLGRDLLRAWRGLLAKPGYSLAVILTLAFGIGPSSAVFELVNSLLLRPLPYAGADRLAVAWQTEPKNNDFTREVVPANFRDWRQRSRSFERLAGFMTQQVNLGGTDHPERVPANVVTADFFPALGVRATHGRALLQGDFDSTQSEPVVISDGLWRRAFGADPGAMGRKVLVDGHSHTVVGVMPPGFQLSEPADVWMPLVFTPADFQDRTTDSLVVFGKVRRGVSLAQAQHEMDAIAAELGREYPASNSGSGVRLVSLRDQLVGGMVEGFLFTLLGAALVVLVLAAANVLQLLLIRAEVRERAVALRVALGGRRGDVLWPLMAESTTLSVLGGVLGLGLASWLIALLVKVLPPFIPDRDRLGIDGEVVWFTLALAAVIGVVVALAPALRTFRSDLTQIFKEGSDKGSAAARPRLQKLLAVSEVALALLLLCSAGLLLRSFLELRHTRPGFEPDHLLTLQLALPQASYPQDSQAVAFSRRLQEELERLPGVRSAGAVTQLPLSGSNSTRNFFVEGHPLPPGTPAPEAYYRVATPRYFHAMGIPLIAGRDFLPSDDAHATPKVVISRVMAEQAWPGENPVGKRLSTSADEPLWREVIGVVGDVKHWGLDDPKTPFFYAPLYAAPRRELGWAIRVSGREEVVVPEVRDVIRRMDPNLPATVVPMSTLMERSMTVRRVSALLFGQMSAVALLLGLVGLYSVIHYMTARRRREIAIYMALGAQRSWVLMLMLRQGFWLVSLGLGAGLAAALAATRLMKGLLFGVDPLDAITLSVALLLLGAIGLLAVFIPARRATLIDPVAALRNE